MLKIKCDINQQYLKTVDLHFVKSELFSLTWSCGSRQRDTTSSGWKFRLNNLAVKGLMCRYICPRRGQHVNFLQFSLRRMPNSTSTSQMHDIGGAQVGDNTANPRIKWIIPSDLIKWIPEKFDKTSNDGRHETRFCRDLTVFKINYQMIAITCCCCSKHEFLFSCSNTSFCTEDIDLIRRTCKTKMRKMVTFQAVNVFRLCRAKYMYTV